MAIRVNHYHFFPDGVPGGIGNEQLLARLDALGAAILENHMGKIREELALLEQEINRNTSVDDSAKQLIQGIVAKLDEAGEDVAKIVELRETLRASTDSLVESVTANTLPTDPPADPPVEEPPADGGETEEEPAGVPVDGLNTDNDGTS